MRAHRILASIVLLTAALPSPAAAQEPQLRLPGPSTVTGQLVSATASHGGTTEQVLLVVTATRTLLLTSAPAARTALEELVGKRVVATGAVVTEHPGEDGKRKEQRLQLVTAGERPTAHALHPAAAKQLKSWHGKTVRVRAWVGEDGIDAVETVAAADPVK